MGGTLLLLPTATLAAPPRFQLPIACTPGKTCFIQQYADHDPGPGAKDYRCGGRIYDGHDGTDIRLPTLAAQRRGVAVRAAAAGVVLATRDGVADHLVAGEADRAAIRGQECGNGVLIGHPDGWQTQYCHMAAGSIAVTKGQAVRAGDPLGRVGLSGDTQFPHLHFAVRQGEHKVDPFLPGAAPGSCSPTGGATLWAPEAAAALAYRSTEILNLGLAAGPVTMDGIEAGVPAPTVAAPALVAYARAIGMQPGDRMRLTLRDPLGAAASVHEQGVETAKAQYMLFTGLPRLAKGWTRGRWGVSVMVLRAGKVVASGSEGVEL